MASRALGWMGFVLALSWTSGAQAGEPVLSLVRGGTTSVELDLTTLAGAGLTLSGVSSDVIVPGSLSSESVAFRINPRAISAPLEPTTFGYDSADFAGTFSGTIEHAGSVFFNAGTIEVGDFQIAFDASRITDDASGFFVASTTGLTGPLFDVEIDTASPVSGTFTVTGELLVSPELAGILGDAGLAGLDVGDARVDGVNRVLVAGGKTNVVLDFDLLETAAGLVLSGVSEEVINPGLPDGSVAFPINPVDGSLPTDFEYLPEDFLSTFAGTIEHAGSVFFNSDTVELGDFTIGFDGSRADADRTGFFVTSNAGVTGPAFDVATTGLALDPGEASLEIGVELLLAEELATTLGDAGLAGAAVGTGLVQGYPSLILRLGSGATSVALDPSALTAAGLTISSISDEVIVPGSLPDSVGFPILGREADPLPTTFLFDPSDFPGTFDGTIEHAGTVSFNGDSITLGDFTIAFDDQRIAGDLTGFFVSSNAGVVGPAFDLAVDPGVQLLEAAATELVVAGELRVSSELAGALGDSGLTGVPIGDAEVVAAPEAGSAALAVAALGTLAMLRRRSSARVR